jgi:hypothetical protein
MRGSAPPVIAGINAPAFAIPVEIPAVDVFLDNYHVCKIHHRFITP